jgi:hypothetical protein
LHRLWNKECYLIHTKINSKMNHSIGEIGRFQ